MIIVVSRWTEEYMQSHTNVSIYADGTGSAEGIKALINGETDIATSSRPMLPFEIRLLAEKHKKLGVVFRVAKDALSIYLNQANPVRDLTLDQVRGIFTGKIKNWNEIIPDFDKPIMVIIRPPSSGTYLYFKEHVLNDDSYLLNAVTVPTTMSVVESVFTHPNAIGYGGTAYGGEVIHCRINGIQPTVENVHTDRYPIARYLYLMTIDTPTGAVKDFIDWIISPAGQSIVAKSGFIPLFGNP